jgi:ABC-type nitrate/sulfonate/bicarbonate transport system, permease component
MTDRLGKIAAPVVVGLLMLGLWQLLIGVLGVGPATIPTPTAVAAQYGVYTDIIVEDALITGGNALAGLLVGAVLGILLAAVAANSRIADGMLVPVVAALAVVPIVALTPIFNTMFGASTQFGRQAIAAIAAFVPVFVNVLRGLRQTRPVHRDLLRAYAASRPTTFRMLTLPTALPYLLTGLRIAASLAVISALVAEYFGGPADGLGTAIASYAKSGNAALAWAYVGAGIVVGLVFFLVTLLLETLVARRRGPAH